MPHNLTEKQAEQAIIISQELGISLDDGANAALDIDNFGVTKDQYYQQTQKKRQGIFNNLHH